MSVSFVTRVFALLATLALGIVTPASAQNFPNKPVRLIYPFAPGTTGDVVFRALASGLSKTWKQPVIVESKVGAGGVIAADYVLSSPQDGYTMLAGAVSTLSLGIFSKVNFDPAKDFRLVGVTHIADIILATTSQVPVRNLAEFVAYAKANPGKLNYASLGKNSIMMYLEWFKRATGAPLTEIPYKGTPEQIEAMLRNDVHLIFIPARSIKAFVDNGKMTPLFILAPERFPDMPNVPTNAEAGLADYRPPQWTAVLASAKVPDDVVSRFRADMAPVIASPEMAELLFKQGNRPFKGTSKEADELYIYSARVLIDLAKDLNLKPD